VITSRPDGTGEDQDGSPAGKRCRGSLLLLSGSTSHCWAAGLRIASTPHSMNWKIPALNSSGTGKDRHRAMHEEILQSATGRLGYRSESCMKPSDTVRRNKGANGRE